MIKKSTWLHLRIPFSFYLLPVYLFAWSISDKDNWKETILSFFIIHLLLYPASNAYNSYFDKDEDSIGGLEKPPPVSKELYNIALIFDILALLLGLLISWQFVVMLVVYGFVSKAYSHPSIRLKKYAFASWLIAGLFQGFFTFLMAMLALNKAGYKEVIETEFLFPALLSSVLLWGSYPMTQIYQHKEDRKRGDNTMSIKLGVLGTFHFTAIMFFLATILYSFYFYNYHQPETAMVYILFLIPIFVYFFYWYLEVKRDIKNADYKKTMMLNLFSSIFLNGYFLWLGIMSL